MQYKTRKTTRLIGTTVIAKVGTPFGQQRKEKSSVVTESQPSEDDGDLPKKPTL